MTDAWLFTATFRYFRFNINDDGEGDDAEDLDARFDAIYVFRRFSIADGDGDGACMPSVGFIRSMTANYDKHLFASLLLSTAEWRIQWPTHTHKYKFNIKIVLMARVLLPFPFGTHKKDEKIDKLVRRCANTYEHRTHIMYRHQQQLSILFDVFMVIKRISYWTNGEWDVCCVRKQENSFSIKWCTNGEEAQARL